MTRFGWKGLLFGGLIWVIVLVVGLVTGNVAQIVAGALVAAFFFGCAAWRYRADRA